MENAVTYRINDDNIAVITLNRAEKHNAFNDEMIKELEHLFKKAGSDHTVRAVVLQAEGKSFSAGADLNWMKKMASYTEEQNHNDAMALATMLHTLHTLPKPTIAKVQGAAFGGAIGLIACCDIAIGSKLSKFCLSEVKIGLIPATISPYVIEAMGTRICRRYFQTAEVFSARRARRLGLLSEVVNEDELDSTVDDIIEKILKNGPQAVSQSKALVQWVSHKTIDAQMLDETSKLIAKVRTSEEGQEGLSAFLEKRSAAWLETK